MTDNGVKQVADEITAMYVKVAMWREDKIRSVVPMWFRYIIESNWIPRVVRRLTSYICGYSIIFDTFEPYKFAVMKRGKLIGQWDYMEEQEQGQSDEKRIEIVKNK